MVMTLWEPCFASSRQKRSPGEIKKDLAPNAGSGYVCGKYVVEALG
jgi:hypothetical protein